MEPPRCADALPASNTVPAVSPASREHSLSVGIRIPWNSSSLVAARSRLEGVSGGGSDVPKSSAWVRRSSPHEGEESQMNLQRLIILLAAALALLVAAPAQLRRRPTATRSAATSTRSPRRTGSSPGVPRAHFPAPGTPTFSTRRSACPARRPRRSPVGASRSPRRATELLRSFPGTSSAGRFR